ncbi:hypothetical protein JTE90_007505 [Oedothorax gibbosus]|nr:hypothetical protein JTE90_007505 [Oedothorax gibbosus]
MLRTVVKRHNWRRAIRLLLKRSLVTGIPELMATKSLPKKVLRFSVIIFCLFSFFYTTLMFLMSYWKYPTVMDVKVEYPDYVDIPAVTVCSSNGITATLFCNMYPTLCTPHKNFTAFCQENLYFCDTNFDYFSNISLPAITPYELPPMDRLQFKALGNKAKHLIESCVVSNSTMTFSCHLTPLWISVIDTMGLPNNCYALNSYIGNVSRRPYQFKSKNLVHIKINTVIQDTFYTSAPSAFQIAVHSPRATVNPFKRGHSIKPCYNYYFYISKVINELMPYPYDTNCTDYMALWEARGGYGPLTRTQCREECSLNVSLEDEGCVDPFYVSYPNEAKICNHPANARLYFSKCRNACSRACYREDLTAVVEEHASLIATNAKQNAHACSSIITLAFNRMEVKTFSYYPKYQQVELFGYIGGYLGVFLGISLVAVSDVLETFFVIVKIAGNYLWRRKQKKVESMTKKYYSYHADSRGNFRFTIY